MVLNREQPEQLSASGIYSWCRQSSNWQMMQANGGQIRVPTVSEQLRLGVGPEDDKPANPEGAPELRPRIYVASLSDYNAGRLHGAWINAYQHPTELADGIQAMLERSQEPGAEEWAIHDHQDFGGLYLSEYESLETVCRLAEGLVEHGPAFAGLVALLGTEDADGQAFTDRYRGHWQSVEDYADELLRDLGAEESLEAIPTWLRPYVQVNVSGFARDLTLGGDIHVTPAGSEGGVYVFDATT
jgi:antirestriction protein